MFRVALWPNPSYVLALFFVATWLQKQSSPCLKDITTVRFMLVFELSSTHTMY